MAMDSNDFFFSDGLSLLLNVFVWLSSTLWGVRLSSTVWNLDGVCQARKLYIHNITGLVDELLQSVGICFSAIPAPESIEVGISHQTQ